ncbi:hypothetical protein M432DRAFT_406823 [Thermoascus aurantiacus ATCC 26904]
MTSRAVCTAIMARVCPKVQYVFRLSSAVKPCHRLGVATYGGLCIICYYYYFGRWLQFPVLEKMPDSARMSQFGRSSYSPILASYFGYLALLPKDVSKHATVID